MKNLVFAGTPEIAATCLQALLADGYHIQACLTQPDRPKGRGRMLAASPVKQLAMANNIPVYQPAKLRGGVAGSAIIALLRQLAPEVMIVVAYGLIIPIEILAIPKYGCLNVHTSLLPRWRGAAPIQHAILAGDQQTGVTIMQMDEGLDTGAILSQYSCEITDTTTADQLYQNLAQLGSKALLATLRQLAAGTISQQPQAAALATYAHKIEKIDGLIDWRKSAQVIERQIRAYNSWPVAYTYVFCNDLTAGAGNQSIQLRIWEAQLMPAAASQTNTQQAEAGTILTASALGLEVVTGAGSLLITKAQLPGKKVMLMRDILNSQQALFKPGSKFVAQEKQF